MRRLLAALLSLAAVASAPSQQRPFVARNGTFQIELPAGWRQLAPGEARMLGALPDVPPELGYVEPSSLYAIGPVDEWLQGHFDTPWIWVVEQGNEWVVEHDFADRLRQLWDENGAATGERHELSDVRRDTVGPQHHAVLTAVRTSTPRQGPPVRRLDVYAPTGGRQVSLSFSCRADRFEGWLPRFRSWLETVRFARPAQGEPQLGDRLWTPLLTGGLVSLLLLVLYKHTRRQR
ncbi:MAG: hypothetical protein JNM25_07760 [Planctomycetes bacterium]|nr:hypothetical protein [Planctomycetota bacterium]